MIDTDHAPAARLTGILLLTAVVALVVGAAIVVPTGLTLNPSDPEATLVAVGSHVELHLLELGFDVLGWLALTGAGLVMAARAAATGSHLRFLSAGLLAAAGLAGVLHDAGNLAVTQLAADPTDPMTVAVARGVLLTAKWAVNLAGLLWVAALATAALGSSVAPVLRRTGVLAALLGAAAVVLPWTTGLAGPSSTMEQLGYALHLPVMVWYGAVGWLHLRGVTHDGVSS